MNRMTFSRKIAEDVEQMAYNLGYNDRLANKPRLAISPNSQRGWDAADAELKRKRATLVLRTYSSNEVYPEHMCFALIDISLDTMQKFWGIRALFQMQETKERFGLSMESWRFSEGIGVRLVNAPENFGCSDPCDGDTETQALQDRWQEVFDTVMDNEAGWTLMKEEEPDWAPLQDHHIYPGHMIYSGGFLWSFNFDIDGPGSLETAEIFSNDLERIEQELV